MQVPLEITYRNVEKNGFIDGLIRRKVAKLEKICDYMISCRVAVERQHQSQQTGNPFLVRIDIKVPPRHEIVVRRSSVVADREEPLDKVLRKAFDSAERRLTRVVERQHGEVKAHTRLEPSPAVRELAPEAEEE